jgi:hypothetical protein
MKLPGETDILFNALRQSAKPKPVSAIENLIQEGPDHGYPLPPDDADFVSLVERTLLQ